MRSQGEFGTEIHWLCKEIGVPDNRIVDYHRAQKSIKVKISCDQLGKILKIMEKGTPWSNRAELHIGLLKEAISKDMHTSHSLMLIWEYATGH